MHDDLDPSDVPPSGPVATFIAYCAGLHREADALEATKPKRAWRLRVRAMVWQAAAGRCVECDIECATTGRGARRGTLDHRWPKSKGGGWKPDNLQLMCSACNIAKADSLPPPRSRRRAPRVGARRRRRRYGSD